MTREELMKERKKLIDEVMQIDKEIAELNNTVKRGKMEKICKLFRELYDDGETDTIEIKNYDGDFIDIDLDDLVKSLEREWLL